MLIFHNFFAKHSIGDELKGYTELVTNGKGVWNPQVVFGESFTHLSDLLIYELALQSSDLISLKSTNVSYR